MEALKALETLTQKIEREGGNIAESYRDWLLLGYACASFDAWGGRDYYHRLSKGSGKYTEEETNVQYAYCLKAGKDRPQNIGLILKLAAKAGFWLRDTRRERPTNYAAPTPPQPTPQPAEFPSQLVRAVAGLAEDEDQQTAMLTSLAALVGAVLPSVTFRYDGRQQHLQLYYCLCAPAASGKSCISHVAALMNDTQESYERRNSEARQDYKRKRREAKPQDRDEIAPPPLLTLRLPADTSTAALLATLRDNGGGGIMWESELDTLTRNFKGEYGNFSDALRKNWHSETISSNRKKDRELINLAEPWFALVTSGTPDQIAPFFGSADNGLFSRFLWGTLPLSLEWRNMFLAEDKGGQTADLSRYFAEFAAAAKSAYPQRVKFTPQQEAELNANYTDAQADLYDLFGGDFVAVCRRTALAQLRIAAAFTALGAWERQEGGGVLTCSPSAWQWAAKLARASLVACCSIYPLLGSKEGGKREQRREGILAALPPQFTAKEFPEGVSKSAAYRLLALWEDEGRIVRTPQGWRKA